MPGNIEELATFIHNSAVIGDRVIHFKPGKKSEKLLEVPFGHPCPMDGTITITVGLVKKYYNMLEDRDPRVGITNDDDHLPFVCNP